MFLKEIGMLLSSKVFAQIMNVSMSMWIRFHEERIVI
jgi:hypothetical protein